MDLRRQDFIRRLKKHNKKHIAANEELKGGDVYSNSMILKLLSSDGKDWTEVTAEHRKAFEKEWESKKTLTPCPEFADPWIYAASQFLRVIAFKIASQTSLKYDIKRIYRPELIIPLDILKDEDKTSTEELVKQKVNTLKTFLETEIDLSRCDQREKHKLSVMDYEDFRLEIHTKFGVTPVKLKKQNIKKIKINSIQINIPKPSALELDLNSIEKSSLKDRSTQEEPKSLKTKSLQNHMKGGGIWDIDDEINEQTKLTDVLSPNEINGNSDEKPSDLQANEELTVENLSDQTSEQTDSSSMEEEYDETSSSIKPIDEIIEDNENSIEEASDDMIDEVQNMTGGVKSKAKASKPKDKSKPRKNTKPIKSKSNENKKAKSKAKPSSNNVKKVIKPMIKQKTTNSKPFEEMGFMFNGLHIFEHLMCTPWVHMKKFSTEDLVCLNGFTTNLGLMYVYTVHNSKASFQVYLDEMISWLNKIRTPGFWHEHMKDEEVQMEIERTISETIDVPWMVDFARSSGSAFEGNYREEVFEYWSNQPLKITLIHPYQDVFIPHLDSPRHVQKPSIPTFDYLPMQALTTQSLVIYKKSTTKELAEQVCDSYMYTAILRGDTGVDIQRMSGDGSYFEISMLSTYREDVKNFKDILKLIMLFESSTLGLFEPIYPDEWI